MVLVFLFVKPAPRLLTLTLGREHACIGYYLSLKKCLEMHITSQEANGPVETRRTREREFQYRELFISMSQPMYSFNEAIPNCFLFNGCWDLSNTFQALFEAPDAGLSRLRNNNCSKVSIIIEFLPYLICALCLLSRNISNNYHILLTNWFGLLSFLPNIEKDIALRRSSGAFCALGPTALDTGCLEGWKDGIVVSEIFT